MEVKRNAEQSEKKGSLSRLFRGIRPIRIELVVIGAILLAVNLPLLAGGVAGALRFDSTAVADGQWWRTLLHPLVHLSWYHLILDGGAFLLLWAGFDEQSFRRRLGYAVAGGAGSLLWSLAAAPSFAALGLCGLSGTAHGLMAAQGLETATDKTLERAARIQGALCLMLLAAKVVWEGVTGRMLFEWVHFGYIGTPVVSSHVGGVAACVLLFGLIRWYKGSTQGKAVAAPA